MKESGPSFDRELVSRHYLTVEARDDLGKGNRNTAQLIVNILDVNDNPPVFLQNKYEAVLRENEEQFESPLIVEAFDIDLNGNFDQSFSFIIFILFLTFDIFSLSCFYVNCFKYEFKYVFRYKK